MKGGILKDGRLFINRGGIEKPVDCRFCTSVTHVHLKDTSGSVVPNDIAETFRRGFSCSDHCPHFSEPEEQEINDGGETRTLTLLDICHDKTLSFTEFKDGRKPQEFTLVKNNG